MALRLADAPQEPRLLLGVEARDARGLSQKINRQRSLAQRGRTVWAAARQVFLDGGPIFPAENAEQIKFEKLF